MREFDLTGNPRLPILIEAVRALSGAGSGQGMLASFATGMRRAYGTPLIVTLDTRGLPAGQYRLGQVVEEGAEAPALDLGGWLDSAGKPVRNDGLLNRIVSSPAPKILSDLDLPDDPALGDRAAKFGSLAAAPLFRAGEPLGWFVIFDHDPNRFVDRDLEELILRTNLIGALMENVRLAGEVQEASRRIRAEVDQIADIQRSLLPRSLPHIPGLEASASFETFDRAGGDLYDVLPLKHGPDGMRSELDGPWVVLIADASGHGPAAAVVAAIVQSVLHAFPRMPEGPGELLEYLNRHLFDKQLELTFVTAFLAIYDPATRTLRYANAGHNPPLLKHPGQPTRRLDEVGSPPLGVLPSLEIEEAELSLRPDDMLLLYTDGITETTNADGKYFGTDGIERAMDACTEDTASCVIRHIRNSIEEYEAGRRPSDDQTLLAFRVL
jgi:sigma-B regulation protein RsbU (phosphoserine phosphatase)